MPAPTPIVSPFFESPPRVGGRRLLLVSYHFPPDPNVGSLRWEMMLRHAAEDGWCADVLMMETGDGPQFEQSRLSSLPPGTRLFGVRLPGQPLVTLLRLRQRFVPRARRSAATASELTKEQQRPEVRGWTRVLRAVLDRPKRDLLARSYYRQWRRWAGRAASYGIALSKANEYECVISSGPPHMAHDAARQIAQSTSLKLITDFRDPWTSEDVALPGLNGEAWKTLSDRYERLALEASSLIVTNTASSARFVKAKYPHLASNVITIMNGADPRPESPANPSPRFTIAYAGSLYGGRYPQPLFRAVRLVAERRGLTSADLAVHFIGVDESQREPLMQMASREGIEPFFTCETWRPRSEAMALLDRSSILVLLPQVHVHSVPAKLFEYMQRPVWVLVLSEAETAVAELLRDTAADVVLPDDVEAIADVIGRRFDESRNGRKPQPLNADGTFSRERQTELLFREIERVTGPATDAGRRVAPGAA